MHREVEKCTHTIPLFVQCKVVSEMVLELAHSRFKGCLETKRKDKAPGRGMEEQCILTWILECILFIICRAKQIKGTSCMHYFDYRTCCSAWTRCPCVKVTTDLKASSNPFMQD